MPSVIITPAAARDIKRLADFLSQRDNDVAQAALHTLSKHISALKSAVLSGRPTEKYPLFELVIPFGGSGYVLLYRETPGGDTRYVLAIRHQREIGYKH